MPPIPSLRRVLSILTHSPTATTTPYPTRVHALLLPRLWPPTSDPLPQSHTGATKFPPKPAPLETQTLTFFKWAGIGVGGAILLYTIIAHGGPYLKRLWRRTVRDCCHHGDDDDDDYVLPQRRTYGIMASPENRVLHDLTSSGGGRNKPSARDEDEDGDNDEEEVPKSPISDIDIGPALLPTPVVYRPTMTFPRERLIPAALDVVDNRPKKYKVLDRIMWPGFSRQVLGASEPNRRPQVSVFGMHALPPAHRIGTYDGVSEREEQRQYGVRRGCSRSVRQDRRSGGTSAPRTRYGNRRGRGLSIIQESPLLGSSHRAGQSASEASAGRRREKWWEPIPQAPTGSRARRGSI